MILNKIEFFFCFSLIFVLAFSNLHSYEERIRNIYIERKNVFDSTQNDWFFAGKVANFFHFLTKEYIIKDELLFKEGEIINEDLLAETERNLRTKNLFTSVKIELDSAYYDEYDVYVITQDRWSTRPQILFSTGGEVIRVGGRFEELNLFGTGHRIMVEGLYRKENEIGWQGTIEIDLKRIFRTEVNIFTSVVSNKYWTEQFLSVSKPFRTLNTKWSWQLELTNAFGKELIFDNDNQYEVLPFNTRKISFSLSKAWRNIDRVFASVYFELQTADRAKDEYRRAFDNSGKFLLSFSSVSENFIQTNKLNTYLIEDVVIGGWGTAVLGKIFPLNSKGFNYYYLAGQGEKSIMKGDLYLFGQITGASAFTSDGSAFTYEEFLGLGFYRFSKKFLLASRVRQQTVWNWFALRQLILDNDAGLRGFPLNFRVGDNRIISNTELRFFPDWQVWIFNFGSAIFFDIGTVWHQDIKLEKTQWHSSAGIGLRIYDMKSTGSHGIYRLDFAFNLQKKQLFEIVFSTDQVFSVFQNHNYKHPKLFGINFIEN